MSTDDDVKVLLEVYRAMHNKILRWSEIKLKCAMWLLGIIGAMIGFSLRESFPELLGIAPVVITFASVILLTIELQTRQDGLYLSYLESRINSKNSALLDYYIVFSRALGGTDTKIFRVIPKSIMTVLYLPVLCLVTLGWALLIYLAITSWMMPLFREAPLIRTLILILYIFGPVFSIVMLVCGYHWVNARFGWLLEHREEVLKRFAKDHNL